MKTTTLALLTVLSAMTLTASASRWTDGMHRGKAEFKSMGPITFGPDGILFIADTKAAALTAFDTRDLQPAPATAQVHVQGLNHKIASTLGTTADQILINDLAVNPVSRNVYLAVSRGRGPESPAVLIKVALDGKIEPVSLDNVNHSRGELPDAPIDGLVGQGQRQSNPRMESITDIAFLEDRILVAGLSNEEFSSTLRSLPFPFKTITAGVGVEIFHGAHGRFETRSPIRTFVPFNVGGEAQLLAAYTCTPLVQFPVKDLKPGAKIKGKTIAELGNRNRPLDMIVYQKDGKDYLLLANSSRGIMKIDAAAIGQSESITSPVPDGAKRGLGYETIESWKGVDQLDRFDPRQAIVLRKTEGGAFDLDSLPLP